jgi:predicted small secreted protein
MSARIAPIARTARTARTTRTRLLAATAVALAALTLTACNDGDGVRGEGPSDTSASSAQPSGPAADTSTTAKPAGNGTAGSTGSSTGGSKGGSKGTSTAAASTQGSGKKNGTGSKTGSTGQTGTRNVACEGSTTKTTATVVSRPLNHLLLTVTNTGTGNCDLTGYPIARFGEAQSVPPVAEQTHPQAVVTLAPGESGYAGVLLSAADGSGGNGYTAKTLEIGFAKGRGATPALPAKGVYVDDKLTVTYWQQNLDDALAY